MTSKTKILLILWQVILPILSGFCKSPLPYLQNDGNTIRLIVDNKPFLMLAGEIGNSSAFPDYLHPHWPKLAALNLNTLLTPVYWETIEPTEGQFDFGLVDGLIADARKANIRLVLLWFGSWKNCMSCYVPSWVKIDPQRFPRAQDKTGRGMEILSPFSRANLEADARAFAALMRHLRQIDGAAHTVIMVQVENEVGMIPDSRDRSAVAESLFHSQVPAELLNHLQQKKEQLHPKLRQAWAAGGYRTSGIWPEVFGADPFTDDLFMAWHLARYIDQVAERGKAEYPLPMFVNAALIRPGYQPGQYASGGPLPHSMDIWKAAAPHIDFLAPDIYFGDVADWTAQYRRPDNPLFIPEIQAGPNNGVQALYAVGEHRTLGFSPFGIESIDAETRTALADAYGLLAPMAPFILEQYPDAESYGLLSKGPEQRRPQRLLAGDFVLHVEYDREGWERCGGLLWVLSRDEFLVAGAGLTITFESAGAEDERAGILWAQEVRFVDGAPQPIRRLNGDQTHQGRHIRLEPGRMSAQRFRLYKYR
ncbi:MAG: DUF5597 domain-containing protein [candidate division KSB1 bacterium]|nr:DUF5597 domain-containing protein [candidate division KSB1 bacterium]